MRAFGINYDTGFTTCGTTTHEPFDPDIVRRELQIIREVLYCDAVRITGGDRDRLEIAARYAAEAGLEVWYCPFVNGITQDALFDFLTDSAERAERLRTQGAQVIFLAGSEISLFTDGFLPGDTYEQRAAIFTDPHQLRTALPTLHTHINTFLAKLLPAVRERFGGQVGYASLPFEGIDWEPFDIVATDAGYRDATNAHHLADGLRALTAHNKPAAVTEYGCATFTGAADAGSKGGYILEFDDQARPTKLTEQVTRNEQEQATFLREMLDIFDASTLDAAFIYTFARYDLPHSETDDDRDFDKASLGIVKVLPDARTGTAYPGMPWEPKAAFHKLAEYGRTRTPHTPTT